MRKTQRKRRADKTIGITQDVLEYIQEAGQPGESYDDVLRRLFGLPRSLGRKGGLGLKLKAKSKKN